MNATNYITLCIGIATILASGITSAVVTYWLNRKRNQFEFMRTKAEALYLTADEYGKHLSGYVLIYFGVIEGRYSWNQMQSLRNEHLAKERKHGGAETMTMLVELYFPSLKPDLNEVISVQRHFNKIVADAKQDYEKLGTIDPVKWLPPMQSGGSAIDKSLKRFEARIIAAAQAQVRA